MNLVHFKRHRTPLVDGYQLIASCETFNYRTQTDFLSSLKFRLLESAARGACPPPLRPCLRQSPPLPGSCSSAGGGSDENFKLSRIKKSIHRLFVVSVWTCTRFTFSFWLYVNNYCPHSSLALCSIVQHITWDDRYATPLLQINHKGNTH